MDRKLRLDIPVLLPEVSDASDACVARLTTEIGARGVEKVHVVPASDSGAAQLCVHFDPDALSLARIRELAQAAGARIAARFGHLTWDVTGIGHERRARTVAETLRGLGGVMEAEASAAGVVHVEFDREATSEAAIAAELGRLGVARVSSAAPAVDPHAGHDHGPGAHTHEPGHSHDDGHDHDHGPEHKHGKEHSHAGHDHGHADFSARTPS